MLFPVPQMQTLFQHFVRQYPESTNSGSEQNRYKPARQRAKKTAKI
jgi:hypothetical protein